jgi:SAM-dependent methyltransferase
MRAPVPSLEEAQRDYYERTAHNYEAVHVGTQDEHSIALTHCVAILRMLNIKTILDVGSGTGRGVRALLEAGFVVKGIEPVAALIEQGEKLGTPKGAVILGDGFNLPFKDGAFDAVCEFGVLHHVRKPNVMVKEMLRVSNAAIFLSDTNRFGRAGLVSRLCKLALWKSGLWPLAYWMWTKGRGCDISECDGIAFSYSVYDSFNLIDRWASRSFAIPTKKEVTTPATWLNPLLTASHVLLCGVRDADQAK